MARKLQDRLALATYKTKHGLDNLNFSLVEAHLENSLKRKRPRSSGSSSSESSSSSSQHPIFSSAMSSSPSTTPLFSDNIPASHITGHRRDSRIAEPLLLRSTSRKRSHGQSMAPPMLEARPASWKSAHNLVESSPLWHQNARFPVSHAANVSFASETSTIPESPPLERASDKGTFELQKPSFRTNSSHFHSSPPRTPPPSQNRALRQRKANTAGEEGADLLLFLASSPSPANPGGKRKTQIPSTPPSNHHNLPSSILSTPNATGFMGGFNTPGQNFSWADFVNITPSPAQGAFGSRTPGLPKTPLAAKEARRRLNLDSLIPPNGSPTLNGTTRDSSKNTGLGMELGGELVS
ncbi:MAG: hypothetical protein LQ351_004004 [Letrouitia transgressa]|nr:MAG: hypothetical protein LQ351_004004 [Letrouitia transgressa]